MEENEKIEEGPEAEAERFKEEETVPITENTANPQPSPLNLTPSTVQPSQMEVHKHPHHVTHKKKWSEYLLEFFMLFLAVFLGFLAENFREHQVEKQRAKEYVESFYEDLKTDTARMPFYTSFDTEKIQVLDSLGDCYDSLLVNMQNTQRFLYMIRASSINRPFIRTDRTLKQLSNAGGFRLLKKEDADSILSYEEHYNNFQDFQSTVFQQSQDNVRATFNLVINFKANIQMYKSRLGELITTFDPKNVTAPVLFTTDRSLLNTYFNDLLLYYRITFNHRRMLLDLEKKQAALLQYFKEKYHFE